ncbi:MAG: hypothetical protein AB8F34_08035, partial [Akkermansiaceae bacterium]
MKIRNNFVGLILTTVLSTSTSLVADSVSWTGSINNLWDTTSANWSGDDTIYTDGDDVLFGNTVSGEITGIVSRSPNLTTVDSNSKITFATGVFGDTKPIGGP